MLRVMLLLAICAVLPMPSRPAAGQTATTERRDVPCDSRLPPNIGFAFQNVGVHYQGKEFYTEWAANLATRPLPSIVWYHPVPVYHPLSRDGTARWDYAGVQVHCWMERSLYVITHHRDIIAYAGVVRPVKTACDGSGGGGSGGGTGVVDENGGALQPNLDESYDPYDPDGGGDCDGTGTGSGGDGEGGDEGGGGEIGSGGGEGGGGVCGGNQIEYYDYVCLDIWVEGEGWVEYWCGVAAYCE